MSDIKSHKERLEEIYQRLHTEDKNSLTKDNIQLRLDSIVTLIKIQSLIVDIQESIQIAQDTIDIDFDRDVDFNKWSNFHSWNLEYGYEEENLSRSVAIGLCTSDNSLNATNANAIVGYYPKIKDTTTEEDANFRDAFRDALVLFSGSSLGRLYLHQAIRNAIQTLCETLQELKDSLDHEYSPEAYMSLYQKLYLGYATAHTNDIVNAYREHKNRRDSVDQDWLIERLTTELLSLYKSKFMQAIMEDLSFPESKGVAIPYSFDDIPKRNQEKFYKALYRLCTFQNGLFDFTQNDAIAGRTIYNYRDTTQENEYEAFFHFRLLATKISEDLKPLLASNNGTTPHTSDSPLSLTDKINRAIASIANYKEDNINPLIRFRADWIAVFVALVERDIVKDTQFTEGAAKITKALPPDYQYTPSADDLSKKSMIVAALRQRKTSEYLKQTKLDQYEKIIQVFNSFIE